ncbi:MAG: class I SAM-dependent methyltransferase [Bulleidia sp.]
MGQNLELGNAEETALIPLACRACERMRRYPSIRDPKAVQIIHALKPDVRRYDKTITHECMAGRTILSDDTVRAYIRKYPDALCVNLGCSMNDRYSRVVNQKIAWMDADPEDIIRVRKKAVAETDRRKMISGSVLETDRADKISAYSRDRPVIVIAEGLLMYFSRDEIRQMLKSAFISKLIGICSLKINNRIAVFAW